MNETFQSFIVRLLVMIHTQVMSKIFSGTKKFLG